MRGEDRLHDPRPVALGDRACEHEIGEAQPVSCLLPVEAAERQVLAATLMLSLKTVRNNVSAIFTKLRVANRAQAMLKARESGLGRGD
jgi:hypothetical protein